MENIRKHQKKFLNLKCKKLGRNFTSWMIVECFDESKITSQ